MYNIGMKERIQKAIEEQDRKNEVYRIGVANKNNKSIGFGDSNPSFEDRVVADIIGQRENFDNEDIKKVVNGKVRVLRVDGELVVFPLDGGNSQILGIRDFNKIVKSPEIRKKVDSSLALSKKARKAKLRAR